MLKSLLNFLGRNWFGILLALAVLWWHNRPVPQPPSRSETREIEQIRKELGQDEKAVTVIKRNRVYHVSKSSGTPATVIYAPPEGSVSVVEKENGTTVIKVKNKGFCFRPGMGVMLFQERTSPVGDLKFAYMNRWGAVGGFYLNRQSGFRGYVGASYLVTKYGNTSAVVGMDNKLNLGIGVRVSF